MIPTFRTPALSRTDAPRSGRRRWLMLTASLAAATAAGCTTTNQQRGDGSPAARRRSINSASTAALSRLYEQVPGSREMVRQAHGVLIFPGVVSAGLVVGGSYGEGELRVGDRVDGYYSTASGSVGWQAGADSRAIFLLFMSDAALKRFRESKGWTAGADANVSMAKSGASASIDTNTARQEVVGYALTNAGLMANLTIDGTKITRLDL